MLQNDVLEKILIIHRHGARVPLRNIKVDKSWTNNKLFWGKEYGNLTYAGVKQLEYMGQYLRKYYNKFVSNININKDVIAYTRKTHRTIFSAYSFLNGFIPERTKVFWFYSNKEKGGYKKKNFNNNNCIIIKVKSKKDRIFYTRSRDILIKKWQINNFHEMIFKKYTYKIINNLLDELHRKTQIADFNPENNIKKRLYRLKSLITQTYINKSHNQPNFLKHVNLSTSNIIYLKKLSNIQWKSLYSKKEFNNINNGIGLQIASELFRKIYSLLNNDKYKFIEFSAHDTNILSLGSLLGIIIKPPYFAGYFIFEKWTNGIKIFYNHNPFKYSQSELKPKFININDKYIKWKNLDDGIIPLSIFNKKYSFILTDKSEKKNIYIKQVLYNKKLGNGNKSSDIVYNMDDLL